MHPLHPYLAICNSPNILCCSHDFVSFCMDYLLHMSYVYLFICLVNFSFVMTQLEGCLFRELFLISSGRTWCFFPGISILFMTLSLSMCYAVHLPEKWLSNFNVPSKQELNLQKFKVMAPTIRNPDRSSAVSSLIPGHMNVRTQLLLKPWPRNSVGQLFGFFWSLFTS